MTAKHEVVSNEAWIEARKGLLVKEKAFDRAREELARERRALPWEAVVKPYAFDGPDGRQTLAELFDGRSQLIVYHFMFGPGWKEGCPSCSFLADHFDGPAVHLANRDVTLAVVSRAPLAEIEAFKKRMGWRFKWVSSFGSDFNFDYHVSFTPDEIRKGKVYYNYDVREFQVEELAGTSMFYKDANGDIFHTYSVFARGSEMLGGAYGYLDHLPKGRNETGPNHDLSDWVRHHDKYGDAGLVETTGRYVPVKG